MNISTILFQMAAIKDEAVVLRHLDYSETSQVLALFTREHGTQRLIAKGIKRGTKKKFATGIDLLERGELVYLSKIQSDARLGTLTEWRQRELYLGLRSSLPALYAAQYTAEITAAMTEEGDPDPELYDAFVNILEGLSRGDEPLPGLITYQTAVLTSAGLWPDLTRCVICNRPAPPGRAAYFSATQGGLICRDCEIPIIEKRKVSAATLTALRAEQIVPEQARDVFELLDYAIAQIIGRPLTLSRFVLSPIKSPLLTKSETRCGEEGPGEV